MGRVPLGRELHDALRRLDEAGLGASFAKFVLDCEQIEMFYRLGQGPQFDDMESALLRCARSARAATISHRPYPGAFQTAFLMPILADNNSFEQWQLDGAKDANVRGLEMAQRLLDSYEPPPLDPGIDEALLAFIREREAVLPDSLE